jgi:GT2 family glycosyltransferase
MPPALSLTHRDVIVFGIIDWHFRFQRPQQLARELARRGHRVLYLSVNMAYGPDPGYLSAEIEPNVWQINLRVPRRITIYTDQADAGQSACLRASLARLKQDLGMRGCIHLVQHPFWAPLATCFADAQLIYDCMDHHAGFHNDGFIHTAVEEQLVREADLCVTSSTHLFDAVAPRARRTELIRNAGDPLHFSRGQRLPTLTSTTEMTVGYYGAIAEWFDTEAVRQMALAQPLLRFELIGDDTIGAGQALRDCPNVHFLGEQPYADLPRLIQNWTVSLIPFQRIPLTLATNPVKVYEYLGAAKAVLATRLPELEPISSALPTSVWLANGPNDFARLLPQVIAFDASHQTEVARAQRTAFAATHTWADRAQQLVDALAAPQAPVVSAIVVTFNQWALTERCLQSLIESTSEEPLEIIVVDNGSTDGTPEKLRTWWTRQQDLKRPHQVLLLSENKGFGGGVNAGLRLARGHFLTILNNDIVLTPSWARCLRRHLERDPGLGLICPTTNNIGNEAQVWLPGESMGDLFAAAHQRCLTHAGETLTLHVAAFFCVMMPRVVYETVGELDEAFFPGYFEDDDYCYRVREAGYEIACAEDAYVFHELSASFNAEGRAKRQALLDRNRKVFESKWGPWRPHQYRPESLPPQ